MKQRQAWGLIAGLLLALFSTDPAIGRENQGTSGDEAIARVNGEPITKTSFRMALGTILAAEKRKEGAAVPSNTEILDRLIRVKLIVQEGQNMGLNDVPDIVKRIEAYNRQTLREMLLMHQLRGLKPDESEVERLYREEALEYGIKSLLFENEKDATAFGREARTKKGGIDALIEKVVSEGKAKGSARESFLPRSKIAPAIGKLLSSMKVGEVSPVTKVEQGFTVILLTGKRRTEDPEAKERIHRELLREKQREALKAFTDRLINRDVTFDKDFLSSLDFEASSPGFRNLLEDGRVVARIRGGRSFSVGDLAKEINRRFFHGIEEAIAGKRVNKIKEQVLMEMLKKEILMREAARQKIGETAEYRYMIDEHYQKTIFEAFLARVIAPDIEVADADLVRYYEENQADFTTPEMIKISSMAFDDRGKAISAIEKLRQGMDFRWAKQNLAAGSDESAVERGSPDLDGAILVVSELPEGLKNALAGSSAGDFRFAEDGGGRFLVLQVHEVFPPKTSAFPEVRQKVAGSIFTEKRKEAIEAWIAKLRQYSDVEILVSDEELNAIEPDTRR